MAEQFTKKTASSQHFLFDSIQTAYNTALIHAYQSCKRESQKFYNQKYYVSLTNINVKLTSTRT